MAFVRPTFNITANYWRRDDWWGVWPSDPTGTETIQIECQLRTGTRTGHTLQGFPHLAYMQLLTYANFPFDVPSVDTNEYQYWSPIVEAPAGSGFWYFVTDLYMVGAGFSNQYLAIDLVATWVFQGALWNALPNWPYAPVWPQINPTSWPV